MMMMMMMKEGLPTPIKLTIRDDESLRERKTNPMDEWSVD